MDCGLSTAPRARRSGQSIIEYLLVTAAIIAAIIAITGTLQGKVSAVMTNALNQIP